MLFKCQIYKIVYSKNENRRHLSTHKYLHFGMFVALFSLPLRAENPELQNFPSTMTTPSPHPETLGFKNEESVSHNQPFAAFMTEQCHALHSHLSRISAGDVVFRPELLSFAMQTKRIFVKIEHYNSGVG